LVEVDKQQFEDKGEATETTECSYYYSGYNYRFSDATNQLAARVYDDEPGIAHIQSWLDGDKKILPVPTVDSLPADSGFFRAVLYHFIQREQCERIEVLTRKDPPYQPIDLARFDLKPRQG
jgi:hypothetical protein